MNKELTANVIDYDYIPSTPSYVKQGVKGGRTPKGSVSGSNGSFVMAGNPPQMIIEIAFSDDSSEYVNIYSLIKYNTTRDKVTKKYCKDIFNEIANIEIDITEGTHPLTCAYQEITKHILKAIKTLG